MMAMIGTTRIIKTSGRGCVALGQKTKKNKLIFFTLTEYINKQLSLSSLLSLLKKGLQIELIYKTFQEIEWVKLLQDVVIIIFPLK